MLTLNQIKQQLIAYMNSHAQVNTMFWGDDFTFASDRDIQYPAAQIQYLESAVANKSMNHTYQVALMDLIDVNNSDSSDEIISDMLQVAEDFITWLQYQEGFSFNRSTQILKLNDAYGDRVAGVRFRITLSVVRSQNECSKPNK